MEDTEDINLFTSGAAAIFLNPVIIGQVLKNLTAKDLCRNSRVCRVWYNVAYRILRTRTSLNWTYKRLVSSIDDTTSTSELNLCDGASFVLNKIRYQLTNARSVPHTILVFASGNSVALGKVQAGLKESLPVGDHTILSVLAPGCVGTTGDGAFVTSEVVTNSTDEIDSDDSEGGPLTLETCFTSVCLPKITGVDIYPVTYTFEVGQKKSEVWKFPETADIKCVLVFGKDSSFDTIPKLLKPLYKAGRARNSQFVLAGAYGHDVMLTTADNQVDNALCSAVCIGLGGQNVRVHSLVLPQYIRSKEGAKKQLQRLGAATSPGHRTVGFIFSCIGRGKYHYGCENVDSAAFREVFPDTPLFGFFGNGEIGHEMLVPGGGSAAASQDPPQSKHTPRLEHGYSSIFCLISFT